MDGGPIQHGEGKGKNFRKCKHREATYVTDANVTVTFKDLTPARSSSVFKIQWGSKSNMHSCSVVPQKLTTCTFIEGT